MNIIYKFNARNFTYSSIWIITALYETMLFWPIIRQFIPNNYTPNVPKLKVNIKHVLPGKTLDTIWRGIPLFIKNRNVSEIKASRIIKINALKDVLARNDNLKANVLAYDKNRSIDRVNANWLVVIALCTHLGCIPNIFNTGWYCSCHGSLYDSAGRVISGPAPYNLRIPKCTRKNHFIIINN